MYLNNPSHVNPEGIHQLLYTSLAKPLVITPSPPAVPETRQSKAQRRARLGDKDIPIVVCVSSTVSCNTAACNTLTSVIPVLDKKLATAIGWLIYGDWSRSLRL